MLQKADVVSCFELNDFASYHGKNFFSRVLKSLQVPTGNDQCNLFNP